jgi:putative methyltransferase (TIGR04325 family)
MIDALRKIVRRMRRPRYGFFGDYKTWQEALSDSKGYDSPEILEKVKDSLLKVKNGEAAYERDSVTFDKIQYSWPVLAGLLWISSRYDNRLKVIDFGGSLGSSYFQNVGFLKHLKQLDWNVVEQKKFVECGRDLFQDGSLHFNETIEEAAKGSLTHVFFASSSIQYIEDPYSLIEKIMGLEFPYIIIDMARLLPDSDRITVQKVRPGIYDASYPAWFLNEKKLLETIGQKYELKAEFDSLGHTKGFIFELRKASARQTA